MNLPISFEFFPPKTPEGAQKLRAVRQQLYARAPLFCSVTYGAGGSTQEGTFGTVRGANWQVEPAFDAPAGGAGGSPAWRGEKHELPGLWFSERELYSLLMAHQLLSGLDADGTLSRHLQPLLDRGPPLALRLRDDHAVLDLEVPADDARHLGSGPRGHLHRQLPLGLVALLGLLAEAMVYLARQLAHRAVAALDLLGHRLEPDDTGGGFLGNTD